MCTITQILLSLSTVDTNIYMDGILFVNVVDHEIVWKTAAPIYYQLFVMEYCFSVTYFIINKL